ncbi:MAG: TonB-dependent receptor [Chitinophagaceae bacterium]|nr:TonB-dependent receptor [Chitinophagaceae bacterium]MCW5927364.1 TonB-dependent receptor [Chitinophagaceae bacterium]
MIKRLLSKKNLIFKRLIVTIFVLLSSIQFSFCQEAGLFRVTGKVIEADARTSLGFATVQLFRQGNNTSVAIVNSAENGTFTLETDREGAYYVLVEFIGYDSYTSAIINLSREHPQHQLGAISLTVSGKTLDEILVQAEKSTMQLALDKKIFNVGKDLANAGGTGIDILSNIPSVAVDVEGNVSLRGSSSVRILIDGKPSGLVSIKGGAGLQQLQANMIERVEIITNPSARYEAEGMGGIINIVLKKERREGFNGSFEVIAGYPENFGLAANVNYRKKNINFFVNYTASYRNAPGRNHLYQEVYRNDSTFISTKDMQSRLNGMYNTARAGLDYFLNEKNIITAAYTYRISKGKRYSDIIYHDYEATLKNLTGITKRTQDETETEPNSEYALTYKKTFKRQGHELVVDLRHLNNWENSDQYFGQDVFNPNGSPSGIPYLLQRSVNFETEKQYLFQLDYIHPFGENGKFETGLRSSFRNMTNDFTVTERDENNNWFELPGLTNDFLYEENIHALYAIFANKLKKLTYQVGARAEVTDVTTTLKQTNEVNPRDYTNLFPSAHLTYDLPEGHALQASYSKRVRRPQYNDLSPFMTYSDNRNYWSGNPDLNPEFTDAFELGHIKYMDKASVSSSVYYRYTTGKILSVREVYEDGTSFTHPENLATENSFGAEFTGSYSPVTRWKMDASLNFFRAIIDGRNLNQDFESDTYSWIARLLSRVTVWKNTDIQFRGNYEAPQQLPQGRRKSLATLDISTSKDILKDKATLTLNIMDVFNSRKYRSVIEGANFYSTTMSQGRLRQVNLTFNYRLRQAKKKVKEGLDAEM